MSGTRAIRVLSTVSLLLGSSVVSAAVTNIGVALPNTLPSNEFSFTALALKPSANNLNYVIFNKELPAQSPNWRENELMPAYSFAFAIAASRVFEEGRDVNLEWTHLYSSTSDSTVAPNANFFLGPDYEIGPASLPVHNATGNAVFRYDVVNLDFGQHVLFGQHVQMHFFAGLSNGYLREQVTATYSGNLTGLIPGPFSTRQQVTSSFIGLGPRLGAEGSYTLDNGFGFLGEAAVSALIGSSYTKTGYVSQSPILVATFGQLSPNTQTIADQTVKQVIPGLDAKVGISYRHAYRNNSVLTVSAGYQAAVYVNAINQYIPQSLVVPMTTGGIFVATMSHTQSNYSVQGPFLKASIAIG
jgi:hypothetical protein